MPSMHMALGPTPALHKLGLVCIPIITALRKWRRRNRSSRSPLTANEVQGQPGLQGECGSTYRPMVWAPELFASFQWVSVSPVAAGVTEIRPAALSCFPSEGLEGCVYMLPASTTRLCRCAVSRNSHHRATAVPHRSLAPILLSPA